MPAKTEKTPTKAPASPKVFDVAKPGKLAPSASSRPIIISNRPVLPDPMVSGVAKDQTKSAKSEVLSPSLSKITIKPLTVEEKSADAQPDTVDTLVKDMPEGSAVKTTSKSSPAKVAVPVEEQVADAKVEEPEVKEVAALEVPAEPEKAKDPNRSTEESQPATDTDEPADESVEKPAADTSDAKEEDADQSDEDSADEQVDGAKPDKETAELEALAKHKEEIQQLVDSKEYVLPINSIERHRSKIAAVVGLILIVLLGLLLVNLLLEFGFIHVGGLKPVITFFK